MKMAQMKERMKAKAETNKLAKETTPNTKNATTPIQNVPISIFSTGETVEKTPRGAAKPEISVNNKKKKKTKK
jgi:hypothetical protein